MSRRGPPLTIAAVALAAIALVVALFAIARSGASGGDDPRPAAGERRLVVLSPALAITLRDLGLEPMIVGRHGFDLVLDKSLPVCGDQQGIDYESLLGANPTHVLLEWGRRTLPPRLLSLADERGWTVLDYDLLTLDQIRGSVATLPADLGIDREDVLARQRELLARADAAWSPMTDVDPPGRTLVLYPSAPAAVMGPGSFHQQILERLGAPLAVTEGAPYIEIGAEDLLRVDPDAIFLLAPRPVGTPPGPEPDWAALERALGGFASLDVSAIRRRRVALIDHPLALTGSTAMIEVAERIEAQLRRWQQRPSTRGPGSAPDAAAPGAS